MATSDSKENIPLQLLDNGQDEQQKVNSFDPQSEPERQDDGKIAVRGGTARQVTTSQWKRVSITVTTMLSYVALTAAISMISPFYPIMAQKRNVPTYVVGFVIGVAPLCMTVFSPLFGYMLPHLGVKFTQLAGLFLAAGSLILFGFVSMMPTVTLFITFTFLLRVVEGIGNSMFSTASNTLLTHLYLERKGMVVGLIELSFSLGNFVGPPIGGGLVQAGGFKLPFLVVGGCMFVLMLLLVLLVRPTGFSNAALPWRVALSLFGNIVFVLLVVCLVTSCSAQMAVIAYFGLFLHQQQSNGKAVQ